MKRPSTITEYRQRLREGEEFIIDNNHKYVFKLRVARCNPGFRVFCNGQQLTCTIAFLYDSHIKRIDFFHPIAKDIDTFFSQIEFLEP